MSMKRKIPEIFKHGDQFKRSNKSWKAVTKAIKYFEEGKYGKSLPLLFKYEDVDARSMFLIAHMYYQGFGVVEDVSKAVSYLEKIINFPDIRQEEEAALAMALFYLGELHYRGIAVARDDKIAERLWRRGALLRKDPETERHYLGSVKCQTALGMFYSNPDWDKTKKAFYWHQKAQQSGSVVSEGALGVMYMYGVGTEENPERAYDCLMNAAILGNIYAKGYLAAFYYRYKMFDSVVRLGRELAAEENYDILAKRGDCDIDHVKRGVALGCFYLALCCQYGYSITKDLSTAKQLIRKAIQLSPDLACDLHVKAILGTA